MMLGLANTIYLQETGTNKLGFSAQNRHFLEKSEFLAKKCPHVWLFGRFCMVRFSPQFKTAGR
jgi:hypothetical protein